ncbi:MAG: hypothetical protein VB081_00480 [Christensenella sp.]|uniref:alginate O-acetyltransferase AlgX-related protein n=1 Tax=Christensenella sp. TaxID=1935934 RepID=UPI002B21946B|nr:hypothetical protein [Christensenella sp.]MEA5001964.1 hypothetical protein [Christensenella sp.]
MKSIIDLVKKINGKVIFVIVFFALIALPLICINTDPNRILKTENRGAAHFPEIIMDDNMFNTDFLAQFETYLADNIGFREEATVANAALKYGLFRKLEVGNFMEGQPGEIFYNTDGHTGIETFQGINHYSEEEMAGTLPSVLAIRDYWKENGAEFLILMIPDKEGIYPERYLSTIIRQSDQSKLELWTQYMKESSDLNALFLKDALEEAKKDYDKLYYSNEDGTHWNMNGAFIGYQQMMRGLQDFDPQLKEIEQDTISVKEIPYHGAMIHLHWSELLNQVFNWDDIVYEYEFGFTGEDKTEDYKNAHSLGADVQLYYYINQESLNDKKLLVIGDSYVYSFMMPMLSQTFKEVVFVSTATLTQESLRSIQNDFQPDYVVFEAVERAFSLSDFQRLAGFMTLT